jgi:exonuclease SbcD
MKHIILGDIHLGKSLSIGKPGRPGKSGYELNSRISDKIHLLYWVLDHARQQDIKHIIITGDVYEEQRPHPTVIGLFMRWLKQCEVQKIAVDIVAGNHDIMRTGAYTSSALDLIPAVEMEYANVHKDPVTKCIGHTLFTFVPYRDRRMYEVDTAEEALDKLFEEVTVKAKDPVLIYDREPERILVGHLSLAGSLRITDEIADSLNEIFVPTDRMTRWDRVIMGHIHHPQVIQKKPHVSHIGSMDRSDFHIYETDIDKFIIVTDDNFGHEQVTLPTRDLRHIEIDVPPTADTTNYIIQAIDLYNKDMPVCSGIVKLTIKLAEDAEDSDRAAIERHLYDDLKVHHICNFQESRTVASIAIDEDNKFDSTDTIPSSIGKFIDYKDDFDSDEQRERVKALANECYQVYEEKQAAKEK